MKRTLVFILLAQLLYCASAQSLSDPIEQGGYSLVVAADTLPTDTAISVLDELAVPDSETGARIVVRQSSDITVKLQTNTTVHKHDVKGFRIQIYSSNRGSAAKVRAFEIRNELLSKHPDLDVYVTYTSPFWKVRIGNCATHQDAQQLRTWIIEQFPDYATETYIVPETVQLP